jgi:FtsZ-binding cell division protein ZapB
MKKCRACKVKFEPFNSLHVACSLECAQEVAIKELERRDARRDKAQRKWVREQKERLKSRGDHAKEAQQAFNAYIRARDAHLHCISCGSYTAGQYHAGHYRTVKAAPELRYDESNCHKQCAQCNNFDSGNLVEYRINLVKRIGQAEVDRLEGLTPPKHYSIDDLKEIKAKYRALARELQKEREAE